MRPAETESTRFASAMWRDGDETRRSASPHLSLTLSFLRPRDFPAEFAGLRSDPRAPVLSHPGPNACPLTALCFDSGESRRDPPLGFLCVSVPVLLLRLKFCGCSWLASAPPVLSIVTANLCPCCVSALHCCGPVHWEFGMLTEVSSRLSLKGDGHGPVWNWAFSRKHMAPNALLVAVINHNALYSYRLFARVS